LTNGISGTTRQPPLPHRVTHQAAGVDEINVDGLHGVLADPQPIAPHGADHEIGGPDQVNVGGLSGVLADPQPPAVHDNAAHHPNYEQEGVAAVIVAGHEANADAHKGQKNSVELDVGELQLVGDQAAPGNHKVYGTDGAGVKGWKDDPASGIHAASHEAGGADEIGELQEARVLAWLGV